MGSRKRLSFNLLDQLVFYGSYHNNVWNQVIHFVFVPGIFWSLMVWLAAFGPLLPVKDLLHGQHVPPLLHSAAVPNAALLIAVAYSCFYTLMDPLAGLSWSLCVGAPLWLTATAFQAQVPHAGWWALGVHIFSWFMQIYPGHAVCEKRKPALMDSLGQAFALAPLFVWFEALFLLGYRPALRAELQRRVREELDALRARTDGRYSATDKGVKVHFFLRAVPRNTAQGVKQLQLN